MVGRRVGNTRGLTGRPALVRGQPGIGTLRDGHRPGVDTHCPGWGRLTLAPTVRVFKVKARGTWRAQQHVLANAHATHANVHNLGVECVLWVWRRRDDEATGRFIPGFIQAVVSVRRHSTLKRGARRKSCVMVRASWLELRGLPQILLVFFLVVLVFFQETICPLL